MILVGASPLIDLRPAQAQIVRFYTKDWTTQIVKLRNNSTGSELHHTANMAWVKSFLLQ